MAPRLLAVLGLAALAAVLVVPAATAHTAAYSVDGRVRASVGMLNEPQVTFKDTGLDLCFTTNATVPQGTARPPILGVDPLNLTATLTAPGGQKLTKDLEGQFGRAGCFTFADPIVLTQPGNYMLELRGAINGTRFEVASVVAGSASSPAVDRSSIMFPDTGVATNLELEQRIAALEAELEADGDKGAPLPAAAWLIVGLAALAMVRRLRA